MSLCRRVFVTRLPYKGHGRSAEESVSPGCSQLFLSPGEDDHVEYAAKRIPVGRFHINQPTMGGRIPIITSITIGCGTWGGNSVSENLTFRHLLNKTRVTREISGTQPWYCTDWDDFEKFNPLAE